MKQLKEYIAPYSEIILIGSNSHILDDESILIVSEPTDEQLAKPMNRSYLDEDFDVDPADSTLIKIVGDLPSAWHK